jgi:MFS family permease
VFAVNAGRLARRFGRVWPAVAGTACMAIASFTWAVLTTAHPSYVTEILPGMLIAGVSAGLTQAPLFAAAGTLPPDRATTGSAVLNMARQVGSAVGVAVVVVVVGSGGAGLAGYHRAWAAEAIAGVLAVLAAAGSGLRSRG